MAGRKPKDKNRLDIDYIVSWALYHSKVPVKKIAKERGQTTASIYWQIQQVDQAVAQKIDKQRIRDACLLTYPLALESLISNLRLKDVSMTQFFLKNILGFIDKIQGEGFASSSPVFIIQSDGDKSKTEDIPQTISKRLRPEQS